MATRSPTLSSGPVITEAVGKEGKTGTYDAIASLAPALGEAVIAGHDSKVLGRFEGELNQMEVEFRQALDEQMNTNSDTGSLVPGLTKEAYDSAAPEVRVMLDLQAKEARAVKKGGLTEGDYKLRTEARLRHYISLYPRLRDDLLKAAKTSGGFGVVPEDLKLAMQEINAERSAGASAGDKEVERLKRYSTEMGVDQTLFERNPAEYWKRTIDLANSKDRLANLEITNNIIGAAQDWDTNNMRVELARSIPDFAVAAQENATMAILQTLGIASITEFDQGSFDPAALDQIRLNLRASAELFKAGLYSRYAVFKALPPDEVDKFLSPVMAIYDVAENSLGTGKFAENMAAYVSASKLGVQVKVGPEIGVVTDYMRGLNESIASRFVEGKVGEFTQRGILKILPGSGVQGENNAHNDDGSINTSSNATNGFRDIENSDMPEDQKSQAYNLLINALDSMATINPNDPPEVRQLWESTLITGLYQYARQFALEDIALTDDGTSANFAKLMARENIPAILDKMDAGTRAAVTDVVKKVLIKDWDSIMRGQVQGELQSILTPTNRDSMFRAPAAKGGFAISGVEMVAPSDFIEDPAIIAATNNPGEIFRLRLDKGSGAVYFDLQPAFIEDMEKSKYLPRDRKDILFALQTEVNELNQRFGPRFTSLVRSGSNILRQRDSYSNPYAIAFNTLAVHMGAGYTPLSYDPEDFTQ